MTVRIETQFGVAKDLDPTYTQIGSAVASGHSWNLLLNVTNLLPTVVRMRAFIADTSWTTGLPTGSTKVSAIAFDVPIAVGDVFQVSGLILTATQKLVVWSETTDGLDVIATGVDITL